MHSRLLRSFRNLPKAVLVAALLATLPACIPAPKDIGIDYSGPLARRANADAPRVVGDKPVLPVPVVAECALVTDIPSRRRSECGIREVMSRYNPGLQMLYQSRLAEKSTLRGNVAIRLSITPEGVVAAVDIASSELNDPSLEKQIIDFMKSANFGALDNVPPWADTYTVEFAPPKEKTDTKGLMNQMPGTKN